MKNVIVLMQPFIFMQKIYLFEDNVLKMETSTTVQDLSDAIIKVCQYDGATDVTLKGAQEFTQKIKDELQLKELGTFGRHALEITLAE